VGFIEKQTDKRDVVAAEAARFFPDIAVAKKANNGRGMSRSAAGLFAPDADFDESSANFVNWLFCHGSHCLLKAGLSSGVAK
jgi:hypothetical protein